MDNHTDDHEGACMSERRGQTPRDNLSDHERIERLEGRMDRAETVLFGFVDVLRIALGHIWNWLNKNTRGGGHE